jgi:3-oxoacyl-[acyl-carrier protein] reductase
MPKFPSSHVSLVTGSSTGIGAAAALDLARAGSRVAVHYNSSAADARKVVAQIEVDGGTAWLYQGDLSTAEGARRLVSDVLTSSGRIDCLVNNAGSLLERKLLLEISDEFWQQVMDVNLNSAFWVTKAVAAHMVERGSGSIINISSIAARNGGGPGAIPYATAKAAMTCMTKGLAKELIAHGIRVNAVHPGVILTPFHERFSSQERMNAMVSTIPQGRAGQPDEIAGMITFLAGDRAGHIVGEAIEINGGMLMD